MTKRRRQRREPKPAGPPVRRWEPRWSGILLAFFLVALAPRLYGGLRFGTDLNGPGTFVMINYDEAGSCRAIVGGPTYSKFIGYQILWIAELAGVAPPSPVPSHRAKAVCQTRPLIVINRAYSAVAGALTVVIVGALALLMWPHRPAIAWTASALLASSNLHIAQSHWGTVDVPQVFFVYLFTLILALGLSRGGPWSIRLSPLFLIAAVWAKWYFFAVLAYVALLPGIGLRRKRINYAAGLIGVGIVVILIAGWDSVIELFARRSYLIWGTETTPFGTGYANIGTWRRWIRNAINLPLVHLVGLGIPACLFFWSGLRRAISDKQNYALWLLHLPALAYAGYMLFLAPVTYYRHYLPLFPTVVLLIAYGLWESRWASCKAILILFFTYPILLTIDSEYQYHHDPRRATRAWYSEHPDAPVYITFYVVPPRGFSARLLNLDHYEQYGMQYLRRADYILLSENWYDTSFPNELNGPIAWNPEWLIKTKPEYVRAYRRILAGEDPNLELEAEFNLSPFMPEFLIHRYFYGSFQLFVGDLKLYRIMKPDAASR